MDTMLIASASALKSENKSQLPGRKILWAAFTLQMTLNGKIWFTCRDNALHRQVGATACP